MVEGRWADGTISHFDAIYFDVIPLQRLIYAYEMYLNGAKISVSLAIVELASEGGGTKLTVIEHGTFFDGYEDKSSREHGTNFLLDKFVETVDGCHPRN